MYRKVKYILLIVSILISGCSYDDTDIWGKVNDLDSRLKEIETITSRLNSEVEAVVNLLKSSKSLVGVTETSTGYELTFSDGTSVSLKHGKDGSNGKDGESAPVLGVKKDSDGIYYWTLTQNSRTDWLLDDHNQKMAAEAINGEDGISGEDGVTPVLGVDASGYWTVDYGLGTKRVLDVNGLPVFASGDTGESMFEKIDVSNSNFVVFHLINGEVVVVQRTDAMFAFVDKDVLVIKLGESLSVDLTIKNIILAEVLKIPDGWGAEINLSQSIVTITAPNSESEGVVSLIAIDNKGNTLLASILVKSQNEEADEEEIVGSYADTYGTFIVLEGNMTSENGSLAWFDRDMSLHEKIFENANNGMQIGNVVQDMYILNGKTYLITQNGDRGYGPNGAVGRFIVCDAATMEMRFSDPLVFTTPDGKETWPQHIVVVSDEKAYIQYAEAGMEPTSGICVLEIGENTVRMSNHVEGTHGAFTTEGATKGRMVYSRGKLFAGTGHSVSIINTTTDKIEHKIEFDSQVKGVAKAADGNIYVALAAKYSGTGPNSPGSFITNTRIVGINHSGEIVHDNYLPSSVSFPVATYSPSIQFAASFNEPYLYFTDKREFYFSSFGRYNYETKTMTYEYLKTPDIYGYCGIHPLTEELWTVSSSTANWKSSEVKVFDTSTTELVRSYSIRPGFSAGIDYAYRFTSSWINR